MKKVKNKQVDQKTYLQNLLTSFTKIQLASKHKMEKCNELLQRKGSSKWDEEKRKKVNERLKQATIEYSHSAELIDQIRTQLEIIVNS